MNFTVNTICTFFCILVLMLSTSLGHALTFDVWHTGMRIIDVFTAADIHDIDLVAKEADSRPKIVDGEFLESGHEYSYVTELFDRQSIVRLKLTSTEKIKLYEIEINFSVKPNMDNNKPSQEGLTERLKTVLTNKYGNPTKVEKTGTAIYWWNPEVDSIIILSISNDIPSVTYTDTSLKEDIEKSLLIKDSAKF